MNTSWIRISIAVGVFGMAFAGALGQLDSSSVFADDSSQAGSRAVPVLAGANRPASVPEGYVITPFGYFHPSCVQSLAPGEKLLPDGRVRHADGSVAEKVAVCNYPRYTPKGIAITAGAVHSGTPQGNNSAGPNTSPEANGWIESEGITTDTPTISYGAMLSVWVVPPQPKADDGQVLYIFPGFQDIDNTESILQPVLQWFNGQWSIASWNCCLNNVAGESPVVNVRYGVVRCEDYPPNRHIDFGNITYDQHMHQIFHPQWGGGFNTTQTPQCNYGIAAKTHEITLDY